MTLFHLHDDFAEHASEGGFAPARASAWLAAVLKTLHESIVSAKTRRLQRELMFYGDFGEGTFDESDVRKLPQRPMILGDKWDF
jgi:hypothetical protein